MPQNKEKLLQGEASTLQLKSSPHSPQLEKSLCSSEEPAQPKISKIEKGKKQGMSKSDQLESCVLSYVKQIASPGSIHETGCSGLVHWDDPEGWDCDGEHVYTHG